MTVQTQNVEVQRLMAKEREAMLRRTNLLVGGSTRRPVRRWLGRQLVRTGTWLANEQPMRPARAR